MRSRNINITQLSASKVSNFISVILAVMLGLVLIFFTGFMNMEVVHNAAHDTRHSSGFPCH